MTTLARLGLGTFISYNSIELTTKGSSMTTKKIIYVGLDFDDSAFHGSGLDLTTGEYSQFRCKPDSGALLKKIQAVFKDQYEIHLCYEAGHLGYSLYRTLRSKGIHCDIVAPSLIQTMAGK